MIGERSPLFGRRTLRASALVMNTIDSRSDAADSDRPSFDQSEAQWFSDERRESRRPSQRPTEPPPSLDDSIADGWFREV
jgi:hypothetical protein